MKQAKQNKFQKELQTLRKQHRKRLRRGLNWSQNVIDDVVSGKEL